MLQACLLFVTGLTLSGVAIYYSVAGLGAIFAGALVPIYIMGTSLEIAKLVAASWLKSNWAKAPWFMRLYMFVAISGLMTITSVGIFGYLSKAHIAQSSSIGIVQEKVSLLDSKIKNEQDISSQYRTELQVLNDQVAKFSELGAVSKGVAVRELQKSERDSLLEKLDTSQQKIASLQEERAPLVLQLKTVEADVGPIKYIAAFVYGDNPNSDTLEKSVTWLIILIVAIFDPLAIALLLAAQLTLTWREAKSQDLPDQSDLQLVEPQLTELDSRVLEVTDCVQVQLDAAPVVLADDTATEIAATIDNNNTDINDADSLVEEPINSSSASVKSDDKYLEPIVDFNSSANIITEEAKRYIVDESKKKTYLIKDEKGQTIARTLP